MIMLTVVRRAVDHVVTGEVHWRGDHEVLAVPAGQLSLTLGKQLAEGKEGLVVEAYNARARGDRAVRSRKVSLARTHVLCAVADDAGVVLHLRAPTVAFDPSLRLVYVALDTYNVSPQNPLD